MAHKAMSPNQREVISAQSTITGQSEYLTSTGGALNVNGSFSITGGATSANQTNGQQLVQIVDAGGEAATVTGGKLDVNATASLAGTALPISGATTAVGVAIVDASGNQISSFGGGTQYIDGSSTVAHPTGTIPVYDNAGTIASVSTTNRLPVSATQSGTWNIATVSAVTAITNALPAGSNVIGHVITDTGSTTAVTGTVTISGTVTANQGTSPWIVAGGGTAGSAATGVVSIQGIASMTPVQVSQATASNLNARAQIYDGTNTANVLKSDGSSAAGNAIMIGGTGQTQAYSIVAAGSTTAFLVEGYNTVSVDIVSDLSGGSTSFEVSDDNTNWRSLRLSSADATDFGFTVGATGQMYGGALRGAKYFRVTVAGSGGTAAGTIHLSTLSDNAPVSQYVVSNADGVATSSSSNIIPVVNKNTIFNGSTFDRSRSIINGNDTIGTGITASGMMAQFDDTSPGTVTENRFGNLRMSVRREAYTQIRDAAGNERGANVTAGNALLVDGTGGTFPITATNLSTNIAQIGGATVAQGHGVAATALRVELPTDGTGVIATVGAVTAISNALPVGANVIGKVSIDQTTPGTTNLVALTAETTKVIGVVRNADGSGNLLTSTTNALDVNLKTSSITLPVSIAGTVVVDDLAAAPTGAAVPANAQYQGILAQNALPSAATPGNLTGSLGDKYGRTVVLPNAFRDIMGTQTTTITASTSETTIITQAASIFNDITSIFISNTSATPASVAIKDATAGTTIFTIYVPANDMRGVSLTTPWPQTTANSNWTATSSASVTSLIISALFVKNR